MNKDEPKGLWGRGHRTGWCNQHVSRQSLTIKNVDLHWEESRSRTSNRGQAGEWAVSALRDKLVNISYLWWKNTNGNLNICSREREWVLDMGVERSYSGYYPIIFTTMNPSERRKDVQSEKSISSIVFRPRSWSLIIAALKELVAWAWLSLCWNLYIRFKVQTK